MAGMFTFIISGSFLLLLYSLLLSKKITRLDSGNDKMKNISQKIAEGSSQFLKTLYKYIAIFIIFSSCILFILSFYNSRLGFIHRFSFLFFILGAILSIFSGWLGMKIATIANVKTSHAATKNIKDAFNVALSGGSVMGINICTIGILGIISIFFIYYLICYFNHINFFNENLLKFILGDCICFAFGAESVALFCRIAGGIFTKAADIGADLAGKIEKNIPEDDIRNPAVIADNVGDNVGDVAGMGADLFGSFVSTIIATMFISLGAYTCKYQHFDFHLFFFPVLFCLIGTILSIFVLKILICLKTKEVSNILKNGLISTVCVNVFAAFLLCKLFLHNCYFYNKYIFTNNTIFLCIFVGLIVNLLINYATKYFTDCNYSPVKFIIQQSKSGHATNVLAGLCMGMQSLIFPVLILILGMFICYSLCGFFGIALCGMGLLSTTMFQLSIDAFGAIADNAGGIAEMSELDPEVRKNTDILDAIGNTTAATGKSFTIASAALTFIVLLIILKNFISIKIDIFSIFTIFGLLLGVMFPYIISSILIKTVGEAAMIMVNEVRRQFNTIAGLIEGKTDPNYNTCIEVSTKAAIKGMFLPGVLTLITPIVLFYIGKNTLLVSFLIGSFVSCILLGLLQSNAGGAWDNAKKAFENGVDINGEIFYKKSEPHKAAITGDTIGDPLKDTSGPAMNIILKLLIFVALLIFSLSNKNFNIQRKEKPEYKKIFKTTQNKKRPIVYTEKKPKVYLKKDKNGNYEKYCQYDNGYTYEKYYSKVF